MLILMDVLPRSLPQAARVPLARPELTRVPNAGGEIRKRGETGIEPDRDGACETGRMLCWWRGVCGGGGGGGGGGRRSGCGNIHPREMMLLAAPAASAPLSLASTYAPPPPRLLAGLRRVWSNLGRGPSATLFPLPSMLSDKGDLAKYSFGEILSNSMTTNR